MACFQKAPTHHHEAELDRKGVRHASPALTGACLLLVAQLISRRGYCITKGVGKSVGLHGLMFATIMDGVASQN